MCSWPLDSPLHCRICASHPDIALERVAASRRPSFAAHAAATRQQRRSAVRSKSCESSQMIFTYANCPDTAAVIGFENVKTSVKPTACPVQNNSSAASSAANASLCNQYKSRKTKSYAFLLIFICVVFVRTSFASPVTSAGQRLILHSSPTRQRYHQQLLQQQRALVEPTPPHYHHLHHRSVPESSGNMEAAGGDYDCQLVVRALRKAQKQANATFQTIRAFFAEFTKLRYNQEPEEVFQLWQMHQLHLKHPYADHILRDYNVTPDATHYEHLLEQPFSRQMLRIELQKVYITLKTLENAFDEVIKNRRANSEMLMHDLNTTKENYNIINKFFEEAQRHVKYDLQETTDAMENLNIPIPEVNPAIEYDRSNVSMGDYLLANEHLSVMQYLRGMYTFLLAQCSAH